MSSLIDRLENAREGSRELDAMIAAYLAGATMEIQSDGRQAFHREGHWVGIGPIPHLSTSIDAALTALPEGYDWHIWSARDGLPNAELRRGTERPIYGLSGATPALALITAILKSRLTTEKEG